jgi:hypothetical protein
MKTAQRTAQSKAISVPASRRPAARVAPTPTQAVNPAPIQAMVGTTLLPWQSELIKRVDALTPEQRTRRGIRTLIEIVERLKAGQR